MNKYLNSTKHYVGIHSVHGRHFITILSQHGYRKIEYQQICCEQATIAATYRAVTAITKSDRCYYTLAIEENDIQRRVYNLERSIPKRTLRRFIIKTVAELKKNSPQNTAFAWQTVVTDDRYRIIIFQTNTDYLSQWQQYIHDKNIRINGYMPISHSIPFLFSRKINRRYYAAIIYKEEKKLLYVCKKKECILAATHSGNDQEPNPQILLKQNNINQPINNVYHLNHANSHKENWPPSILAATATITLKTIDIESLALALGSLTIA